MIEVVESSTCNAETTEVEKTVDEALEALVNHYSDPVHKVDESAIGLPQDEKIMPSVVRFWVDRLTEEKCSQDVVTDRLIRGYTKWIRRSLFRRQSVRQVEVAPGGIPVLVHYELLLSKMLEQGNSTRNNQRDVDPNNNNQNLLVLSKQQNNRDPETQVHYSEEMASDMSLLVQLAVGKEAEEKEEAKIAEVEGTSHQVIAKVALPAMIRLVTHHVSNSKRALQQCTVTMLAFGQPRLGPRDVESSLETTLSVVEETADFLYAPSQGPKEQETPTTFLNLGSHLTRESFWDAVELNGTAWEDDTDTGAVKRTVEDFWRRLHRNLVTLTPRTVRSSPSSSLIEIAASSETDLHNEDGEASGVESIQSIILDCLRALSDDDKGCFARAVRAHFFGRDVTPIPEDRLATTKPSTRLHLGREVEVQEEDPVKAMSKSFLENPSKVHVAMQYIALLGQEDLKQGSNVILEEMLPIIYELLSANAAAHIAMGASGLIHLLSLMASPRPDDSSPEFPFAKWAGSLLPVLDLACQVCRQGPPFALLAQAQSLLCWVASRYEDPDKTFLKQRRKTTRYFFSILDRHSHQVSDPEGLLWALLVGGLIPLLYQHATVPEAIGNVDAMEAGRLGLTALLPILRYSSGWCLDPDDDADGGNTSRKLLAPSVLALVYLLQAAYPIMPRHGGKIMSEILGLLGNLGRQNLRSASDLQLLSLVKDAAGIALVVCGERAEQVLEMVVSSGQYEVGTVAMAEEVRQCADHWKKNRQQQGAGSSCTVSSNFLA